MRQRCGERDQVRGAKPTSSSDVSRCLRITYEFQKKFPFWNFLVPAEELFSSNGGTIRGKGIRERIAGK